MSHVDSAEALGSRLRAARLQAGLTQGDISFEGCSVGYISRIEAGLRVPSLQVVRELARRVHVREAWLAKGVDSDDDGRADQLRDANLALRLDHLEDAAALYAPIVASGTPRERALALAGLGQIRFREDDTGAAIALLEQAFESDPQLADPAASETLGRAYAIEGREEEAIALFLRHRTAADKAGDIIDRLRFSVLLANAQIDAARFGDAADTLAHALAETEPHDPTQLARLCWTQSRLHSLKGQHDLAARHASRAIGLLETSEHTLHQARAYQLLAHIELDRGNPEVALEHIATGRDRLSTHGTPHDHAKFALEELRAHIAAGDLHAATAHALAVDALGAGHDTDKGRCLAELARLHRDHADTEQAARLYQRAIELLSPTPSRYLIETLSNYAALLEDQGDATGALAAYKHAAEIRIATGATH